MCYGFSECHNSTCRIVTNHEEKEEDVHFCEFADRMLFRKFDMPAPIDVEKVTARLDKGMLHIAAAKDDSVAKSVSAAA